MGFVKWETPATDAEEIGSMTDYAACEAGIRRLHAVCADAVWRKDFEAFGNCFTEDGEWRIAGAVLKGRKQIAGALEAVMDDYHRVLMTFRTPILDVGKGTASGRTYVTEQSVFKKAPATLAISTYFERFALEGNRWLFSWRLFQLHYLGPADMSGAIFDNPDYGPPPAMPALDEMSPDHSGMGEHHLSSTSAEDGNER